ncbi:MAG TPA: HIT family protein [Gammaproteobacteria bacterium]|nr:HIT family protein [Gammaproteobacteria bacterium]
MFELHPQLAKDCRDLGSLGLCRLLLMDDANYPWFILVPQREGAREVHELDDEDRARLWDESALLARALMRGFAPDKLNLAALGNQVPQLHVHHIVRYRHDPAWPQPVWGKLPAKRYYAAEAEKLAALIRSLLGDALEEA